MRRLYVEISDAAFDRLGRRATDERRPVRDQAAVELERALNEGQPAESDDGPRQLVARREALR